jgi:succinate dehydrogenase/fumarate reductase cytochrome b subunit
VHHVPETPGFLGWGAPGLARGPYRASRGTACNNLGWRVINSSVINTPVNKPALTRIQAVSGLLFSLFALVHLTNTALAVFSAALYNGFQTAARSVYQSPLLEVALIATLVVHIVSGVLRMRGRRGSKARPPLRLRLHRYAAYYLAIFIFGHIAATRLPALLADAPPFFGGVSFSMHFAPWWFYPYYGLLGIAGLYHAFYGIPVALGVMGVRAPQFIRRGVGFWVPIAVGTGVIVTALLAFGGFLYEIDDPFDNDFARAYEAATAYFTGDES